jgi:cytochrome c oxidase subunit 2|tara:strand:- start:108 stop:563 length:456 start_codon:yes stop_codon:yes gene_type:complete
MRKNTSFLIITVLIIILIIILNNNNIINNNTFISDKEKLLQNPSAWNDCINGDYVTDQDKDIVEIEMSVYQWKYSYCTITVYKNQKVIISIQSLDVPHGIAIEDLQINSFISPNNISKIEFIATESGEFTYYCTVFCGEGHAFHKGTIIVK